MGMGFLRRRVPRPTAVGFDQFWMRRMSTAFQPIRCLRTGQVIGVEALARFPSMTPAEFFAQADASGLKTEVELVAIEKALAAGERLPPGLYLSVNLSPRTLLDPRLEATLDASGVARSRVVPELTEDNHIQDYRALASGLRPLRDHGIRFAIDDLGAGYSCLRHLIELEPDFVKVDRQLVAGINQNPIRRALGVALVGFARDTGTLLVAEGVETESERATVAALGFDAGQGHLLGRPTVCAETWGEWRP